MGCNIRYALVSMLQPRDRLKDRRSSDDEIFRGVWKEVKNRKADKARMEKTRREGKEERKEKNDDRRRNSNSKNRKERRGRCDEVEGNR